MANSIKELSESEANELLLILKTRFEKNMKRHNELNWSMIEQKIRANANKLWSLNEMELTGGEPDVVAFDKASDEFVFYDCSEESPKGRRSYCYDRDALNSRKEFKPKNSALDAASEMGIELLSEEEYRFLQRFGPFDKKTSSWIKTPADVRKLGGAIFADYRYGTIFIYHNGAESYYAARGFRGSLRV